MHADWTDPTHAVLALLVCGHVLADFLFQSEGLVAAKRQSVHGVPVHAGIVALVQGLVVLPFSWSYVGLFLVAGIAVTHYLVDRTKVMLDRGWPKRALTWFLLDQAAHGAVLLLAWRLWPTTQMPVGSEVLGPLATVVAVVVFNGIGGSAIVGATLAGLEVPGEEDEGPRGAGMRIGILERWILLGLIWGGQWGAVGLVLTAKSVARFKKMDDKSFAEVYLVGTMTSVIVAMVTGTVLGVLVDFGSANA